MGCSCNAKQDYSQNNQKTSNVAIVHDFLLYPGGAERVLADIAKMYPDAPIYTLLYDEQKMSKYFPDREIRTSFLQKWPKFLRRRYKFLLPFFAAAMESFDFRDFDLIISSSGAWGKGIVTRLNTLHVAYVHSPMRYVWDENEYYLRKKLGKRNGFLTRLLLSYLRVWDFEAAQRPDVLVANSEYTKNRIKKYYRRNAEVVYPGVKLDTKNEREDGNNEKYFLVISRLSKYKNVSLAVEACNKLQLPLKVIGEGEEKELLQKIAGETVEILGWQSEEEKIKYLQNARALLFPVEDDFGIVCTEALSCGVPVVALGRGGATEIVESKINGELFDAPTVELLADGIRRFLENEKKYDKEVIRNSVQKFNKQAFEQNLQNIIDSNIK